MGVPLNFPSVSEIFGVHLTFRDPLGVGSGNLFTFSSLIA